MKMPQSEAIVGEFEYLNSEARGDKKFIVIAALNIVILVGIIKVFREMRTGAYDEDLISSLPELVTGLF